MEKAVCSLNVEASRFVTEFMCCECQSASHDAICDSRRVASSVARAAAASAAATARRDEGVDIGSGLSE